MTNISHIKTLASIPIILLQSFERETPSEPTWTLTTDEIWETLRY